MKIITSKTILPGEGGLVYAWKRIPSIEAINESGAKYVGEGSVIIAFTTMAPFEPDFSVNMAVSKYILVRLKGII